MYAGQAGAAPTLTEAVILDLSLQGGGGRWEMEAGACS